MRRALFALIGVLLAVALVALGVQLASTDDEDEDGAGDGVGVVGGDAGAGSAGAGAGRAVSGERRPTLEAAARSVLFQGTLTDLAELRLSGSPGASFSGEVIDGGGRSLGNGTLIARGPELAFAGTALRVELDSDGELRLAGDEVRFLNAAPGFDLLAVRSRGRITLIAPTITFSADDRAGAEPVALLGPVTLVPGGSAASGVRVMSQGPDLLWVGAPAALRLTGVDRSRTTLSVAGTGIVRAEGQEHQSVHLGVKASSMDVTATRPPGAPVQLRGDANLLQVYRDGLPVLGARGRVRVKARPGPVMQGGRGWFTWAPENDGSTDMTITRVRPDSPDASWVSLGLARLPVMCGGEECPRHGGDTTGFTRGKAINSVIIPGTGDERDISFTVPADAALGKHQIAMVVEGNFEPVRVVVEFEVVAAAAGPGSG